LNFNRSFEKFAQGDKQCHTVSACYLGSLPDCLPASSVVF
jgi:hypothetical protein